MTGPIEKRKKKRLFRFSLASFLLFISILAGLLGFWLSLVRPTQMQWNAIRHLMDRGVRVETSPSETFKWVKRFLPENETENVNAIFFRGGGPLQPGDLDCLRSLPHLKRLYLECCDVSDADVELIGQHQPLERLALWRNRRLTNASATHLVQLENLEVLDIHSTGINWRACAEFDERQELKVIWKGDYYPLVFQANSDEIEALANFLPNDVRNLSIGNPVNGSIALATKNFKNLERVYIKKSPRWTTEEINSLASEERSITVTFQGCGDADDAFLTSLSECFYPTRFSFLDNSTGIVEAKHQSNSDFEIVLFKYSPQSLRRFGHHAIIADVPSCLFKKSDEDTVYEFGKIFKKMKSMQISNCQFSSFEAWRDVPELKHIQFLDCDKLESINALSNFESLESMTLSSVKRLEHIKLGESDTPNPNLKSLFIYNLPSFHEFNSLSRLQSLKQITINDCDLLRDVSWISGLQELNYFSVRNCPLRKVINLKDLPSLKELKFYECESLHSFADCNFAPHTELTVEQKVIDDFRSFKKQ